MGGVHGHADLVPRLPDGRALRPGRQPGRGHVRLDVHARHEPRPTGAPGTATPRTAKAASDPNDLAVVVLDDDVAALGASRRRGCRRRARSRTCRGDQQFTPVGYGAQSVTSGPGGKTFHYQDVRYRTVGTLNTVTPAWLKISGNPSHDDGNTCYGDSGGPNFLGAGSSETNIIAGTTITGDTPCRSTNVDYRLDTQSARAFLGQYVTLP